MKMYVLYPKYRIILTLGLLLLTLSARSQVSISAVRDFNFGAFYQGKSGGTVDISTAGIRTASGDIVLMNSGGLISQAVFEIDAPKDVYISLTMAAETLLSNGNGNTMTLRLGPVDPETAFYTTAEPPERTIIKVAGTLIVGSAALNSPGNYQGTFIINLNYE
jgi:hypothetical protein